MFQGWSISCGISVCSRAFKLQISCPLSLGMLAGLTTMTSSLTGAPFTFSHSLCPCIILRARLKRNYTFTPLCLVWDFLSLVKSCMLLTACALSIPVLTEPDFNHWNATHWTSKGCCWSIDLIQKIYLQGGLNWLWNAHTQLVKSCVTVNLAVDCMLFIIYTVCEIPRSVRFTLLIN